jgi:DNA-binding response OmpR family regulator
MLMIVYLKMTDKILIVDDSVEDLNIMKSVLEEKGFEVVTADNGADALEQLESDGFKIALIDIKMPTLSGYDLMRLLKERIKHKIRIVYVSIVPEQEVDMEGIDGFIQKPFSSESLIAKVKAVL